MEMRRLGYFVRVAEDGSLTRSAALLRIAQPALSRQMRLLEDELGVPLLVRTARGMRLTEAGEQLRAAVAGPLRELELALANIRPSHRRSLGNLAIGLTPGMAEILGERLGIRLIREFADAAIRIVEGPTGALADWLARGVVDIAVLEEASNDSRLSHRLMAEDEIWLVGSSAATLANRSEVRFDELCDLPLVIQSHHLGIRTVVDAAARQADRQLNVQAHADAPRLARQLATAGLGYALLPAAYCRASVARGELSGCPVRAPQFVMTYHLGTRRTSRSGSGLVNEIGAIMLEEASAVLGA